LLGGAASVVVLLVLAFMGWALLSDDTSPEEASERSLTDVLPARADVERITGEAFASVVDDDPGLEPEEFRGTEVCRTAWQPLRRAVVGGAKTADTTYTRGAPQNHQVEVGAVRLGDEAAARAMVDRVNNDVAVCAQRFFVREDGQSDDWRVQQSAGEWYLRPVVAREGNWYCAVGVQSAGRYVLRAQECRSGPNHVPGLMDAMVQRAGSR
jgi:hypothetical protein